MRKPAAHLVPPNLEHLPLFRNPPLDLHCTLVTPLYGGGVRAGEVDEQMPIRATGIRGQLRFWWRKAHRSQFLQSDGKSTDWEKMFAAERSLWGGIGDSADNVVSSKVLVCVRDLKINDKKAQAAEYEQRPGRGFNSFPNWKPWAGGKLGGYALFPAQGKANRGGVVRPPAFLFKPMSLSWVLRIQFRDETTEEERVQVRTALRWWASFGGVGARTRRGLGAVQVEALDPVRLEEVKAQGYTLVRQDGSKTRDALEAWKAALESLQTFRQGKGFARNPGQVPDRPGRSRWPEPDAIRRITGAHAHHHTPEHPAGDLFPRAQFGLPIIFHFKDTGEPDDHTLQPEGAERMASPVILRPYRDEEGMWHAAALYMPSERKTKLLLKGRREWTVTEWPSDAEKRKEAVDRIPPLKRIEKEYPGRIRTPMAAFLNYFKNPEKFSDQQTRPRG